MHRTFWLVGVACVAGLLIVESTSDARPQSSGPERWITAWGTSQNGLAPVENNTGWNSTKTRLRNEVNRWIRTTAPFDSVIDFDKVVQDPNDADLILPSFNCGDGIHPSPRGYYEMGKSLRLDLSR